MDKVFLTLLNMSLTGAFVIALICLVRLPLRKAPKFISYLLWTVAGFRLVFPFSIESMLSLMPFSAAPFPSDTAYIAPTSALPAAIPVATSNPIQIWTILGALWLTGFLVMVFYSIISIIILKQKIKNAVFTGDNIYEADNIRTPFVIGIFSPKIYMPVDLDGKEFKYILLHELTHIKRHDNIIKVIAYLILCLHWFNPLAWLAFVLMSADMEMSCDERVLYELGDGVRDDYSMSLVRFATNRRITIGCPLAFVEGGIKERVKRVLRFKKPSRIIIISAVMLVVIFTIGFALNKVPDDEAVLNIYDVVVSDNSDDINNDSDSVSMSNHVNTIFVTDDYFVTDNSSYFVSEEILLERANSMNNHVNTIFPDLSDNSHYAKLYIYEDNNLASMGNATSEVNTVYVELESLLSDIRESAYNITILSKRNDTVNQIVPILAFPDIDISEINGNDIDYYLRTVSITFPRDYELSFSP